MTPHVVRHKN